MENETLIETNIMQGELLTCFKSKKFEDAFSLAACYAKRIVMLNAYDRAVERSIQKKYGEKGALIVKLGIIDEMDNDVYDWQDAKFCKFCHERIMELKTKEAENG